jgi:cytochrome c peroxidase
MRRNRVVGLAVGAVPALLLVAHADPQRAASSYGPTNQTETFEEIKAARLAVKESRARSHAELLARRYRLDAAASDATMSGGKAVPAGPVARLSGTTWEELGRMAPEQIREKGLFPYPPLPFPDQAEGGMLFPKMTIDVLPRLVRFDLDFDLPDHLIPDKAPPIYLTTRPDLGDVSKGRVVTLENYYEIFNGLLNPKQLEGLRLLLTQFPQQQFNATEDRRTDRADGMVGVACFDCHVNGHTNRATHLVGDIRPQEFRHRINTPSLRGVAFQRLFGSQRALKTIEDFTEFEQRAAYFDGDIAMAAKKGVNVLERASQVHFMSEFMALLDFPPAPKLDIYGHLDPGTASPAELRGQALFNGKGRCATCHPAPYYTDNSMNNLRAERFYKPVVAGGRVMSADGPIKTFPLRGVKDSPPYLHDGRCPTLDDVVEYFNLIQQLRLTPAEKKDLAAFLRAL